MAIPPVAQQQQQQPQINQPIEKKRDCLKIMKTAERVFAGLAVCFAAIAVVSLFIGMAAPVAIITGTVALVSAVAFTILHFKNKSTIRALADNLDKHANLSDEEQSQAAKMLMNSWDSKDRRALANNLEKFPELSEADLLKLAGNLINSNLLDDHEALANNLEVFLKLLDSDELKLAGILINSEDFYGRQVLTDNLDKFLKLLDGDNVLKLAGMLIKSNYAESHRSLAKHFKSVVGQLDAIASRSNENELQDLINILEAIKVKCNDLITDVNLKNINFIISKNKRRLVRNKLETERKKNLEAKKTVNESSKTLDGLVDGLQNTFECGRE